MGELHVYQQQASSAVESRACQAYAANIGVTGCQFLMTDHSSIATKLHIHVYGYKCRLLIMMDHL